MTKPNDNQGAINALKGMRAQFLYTLYRILNASEQESYFRPEGQYEDLEILDEKNEIIEAIQVKDLNTTVILSDILPKGKDGLIKRGLEAHKMGHDAIIRLISFSDINTEVKELSTNNYSSQLTKKLIEKGLREKDIAILQKHFKFAVFKKGELIETIAQKLIESRYFANIEIATDLLVYWIYISAEKQQTIGKDLLRDRFMNIGSFLSKRESYVKTFNHLILPLKNNIEQEDIEILRTEFFQGISAKYDHILAGLDVKRNEKLDSIRTAFRTNNVVFIHGASGQGKSTLAYRFLKDYCDNNTAFEIKLPPDFTTVYEVINSLEGLSEGLGFPMTLYIDIAPGNKEWVNLITELSSKKNFRFLISIREEDWHSVDPGDKFLFSEFDLKMDETEAKEIYDGLDKNKLDERFTGFDEAWQQFGESGPLLEFVYLITQTQSLKSKIKSQVTQLTNDIKSKDKVEVLKYVSLADSFGARIKYKEFFQKQGIENPKQIIHQLKEEYLVQTIEDDTYLVGLHPIRSSLIKEELFDLILDEEAKYALRSLSFISDNTLLDFLRNSFAHANMNVHELIDQLSEFKPASWLAYSQILKSLLWKGLSDYIKTNKDTLDQVYEKVGGGWITTVNFNFANVIESGNMVESSSAFPEEAKIYALEMNNKFTPKDDVFNYCRKWLRNISSINVHPKINFDWDSFGIFLFWLQHLELKSIQFDLEKFDFETLFNEYPLGKLGQIIFSLKCYNDQTNEAEQKVDHIFIARFYSEFKIFYFEGKDEKLVCKYITDIEAENYEPDVNDIFHARTMRIVELLRLAYPYCKSYAVKGHGHKFSFIPNDYDPSEKNITRGGLPIYQLTKLNSTYINLYSYYHRPKDWIEFVNLVFEQRKYFASILSFLLKSFNLYHQKRDWRELYSYIQDYYEEKNSIVEKSSVILFPEMVIDEWGESGDNDSQSNNNTDIRYAMSVQQFKKFKKEYREYHSSVKTFLKQSVQVINFKLLQANGKEVDDYSHIARVSLTGNLFELYKYIVPFQNQFRYHFEKFVDPFQLCQLEKKETEFISSLCFIWKQYLYDGKFINDKKNISRLALDKMRETKSTFQSRLKIELHKLAKEKGFEVNIVFDEEHKRCLIFTNANDVFLASSMFRDIYELLFSVIGSPEYTSIKFLMLSTNFERFYLVQLYHGKTFNNLWHEFRLYNLREKHVEELAPHSFLPSLIDTEIIKRHDIKSWFEVSEEFQILQKMVDSISIASQLGYHLLQFDELETDDSEIGPEVAKLYIKEKMGRFSEEIQKGINHFGNAIDLINANLLEIALRQNLDEISEYVDDCLSLIYPNEESSDQREFPNIINIKLLHQWMPRLEELTQKLVPIHLLLSSIIIDKILHSPSATLPDENLEQ